MTNPHLSAYYSDAFLSQQAYNNLEVSDKPIDGSNYTVIAISPPNYSGYTAYAFKDDQGNIIIAHRGTQLSSLSDLATDGAIISGKLPAQFNDAVSFTNQVVQQIRVTNPDFDASQIHNTGHSLGGSIANTIAIMNNSTSTSFNALITSHLLADLQSQHRSEFLGNINDPNSYKDRITEIVEKDDIFHNIPQSGPHLGNVVTIDTPSLTDSLGNSVSADIAKIILHLTPNLAATTDMEEILNSHSMQHMLDLIQSQGDEEKLNAWQREYFNNFKATLKHSLETQLNQSLTNQTFSDMVESMLLSLNRGQDAIPQRSDPLILDLDNDGVELVALDQSSVFFDLDNDGFKEHVGWVSGDDGILVLDANHNGNVDNVSELFGYKDEHGNGVEGTEELKKYDLNDDGVINKDDEIFAQLKIWQDVNQNGMVDAGELRSLDDHEIKQINLEVVQVNHNVLDNLVISVGSYVNNDGDVNQLANLDLAIDQTNSGSFTYQDEELFGMIREIAGGKQLWLEAVNA